MSVTILDKGAYHREFLKAVAERFYQMDPKEAVATARYLREWHKSLRNGKTGAWKEDKGYARTAFPATFWHLMRTLWYRATGEDWGADDKYIREAAKILPDLFPNTLTKKKR